jgi:hypothetical protein
MEVGSALALGPRGRAIRQDFGEQIAERRGVVDADRGKVEPFEPALASRLVAAGGITRVVARTPLRIDQRLVRLNNLSETHLGRAIARIDIRVKATRKTPVGPTDVGLRRPVLQAEHYVQIHCDI